MIVDYDFKIVGVSISFESLDIDAQIVYMDQKYQKIEPCGTPLVTGTSYPKSPILTCFLSHREQSENFTPKANLRPIFFIANGWQTVSTVSQRSVYKAEMHGFRLDLTRRY